MTKSSTLGRRPVLAGLTATAALPMLGRRAGAAERLTIIGHAVHQRAVSEGPGGSVAAEWAAANNVELEWVTLGVPEVHERLYREFDTPRGSSSTPSDSPFATPPRATASSSPC